MQHTTEVISIDKHTGLAVPARQASTPNCDARPDGVQPGLLVVHGISLPPGEYGGPWIERLFANTLPGDEHPYFAQILDARVSAHALIRRDGSLTQFVPFGERAWHAGESCFDGRERCNDFSIGVELEGCDDEDYRSAQYVTLAYLYIALARTYPEIAHNPVVGHSDIAPGRKTDPGPFFQWPRFEALVAKLGGDLASRAQWV